MKKIIILIMSIFAVAVLSFYGYQGVNDYIQSSGPSPEDNAMVYLNGKLYKTQSSCSEVAFNYIKDNQSYKLSDLSIESSVKNDKIPEKELTSNYKIFKDQEIYISDIFADNIYIKATVNSEVRYYLFILS
ncbi:MAG: hypothetical protein RSE93_05815 [Oscillospiraceae bacterium]